MIFAVLFMPAGKFWLDITEKSNIFFFQIFFRRNSFGNFS